MKSNAYNMQVIALSLSRAQNHLNLSLKSLKIWVLYSVYQEQSLNLPKTMYSIWVIIKHTMEGETTLKGVNNKMSWFIGHTKTQLQVCSSRSEQIRINDLGATEPPIARIEYQYLGHPCEFFRPGATICTDLQLTESHEKTGFLIIRT